MRELNLSKSTVRKAIETAKLNLTSTTPPKALVSPPPAPLSPPTASRNSDSPAPVDLHDIERGLAEESTTISASGSQGVPRKASGFWSLLGMCGSGPNEPMADGTKLQRFFNRKISSTASQSIETWSAQVSLDYPKREAITHPEAGDFVVIQ